MARGNIWICGGLLLIAAALYMTAGYFQDAEYAAKSAEELTAEVAAARLPSKQQAEKELPAYLLDPGTEMPEAEIAGNLYIGTVSFPALEQSLPVMSDWSYAKLELSPCRYSGSAYLDNMIIAAHNYPGHFGSLAELEEGDVVFFADMSGNAFVYGVTEVSLLGADALQEMEEGDWDLTLFTCTPGGEKRRTVCCARLPEESVRLLPFEMSIKGRPVPGGSKMRALPECVPQKYFAMLRFCFFFL